MGARVTFKHPPVVETVLGVQFQRLQGLTNAHLGAFWQERRADWPRIDDAPPLEEQFEAFGKQLGWNRAVHLKLTQAPSARVQMRNAEGDRMVQLQNCRLDYNWIGPEQAYPRYRTVRPEFDRVLGEFRNLIAEHSLGELVPTQWEVTYVNQMPRGGLWNEPEEWTDLFTGLPGLATTPEGMKLEGFGGHWHFEIEPQRGRLHVELQQAFIGGCDEKQEVLVMRLTARGPLQNDQEPVTTIDAGLNLGHDTIVTSFRDLTSRRAHDYWNREVSDADG